MGSSLPKLPAEFNWRDLSPFGMVKAVSLEYRGKEIAVIGPLREGWMVSITQPMDEEGARTVMVGNRQQGMAWAAKWVKQQLTTRSKPSSERRSPMEAFKASARNERRPAEALVH
jgi:hypothetical protein